MAPTTPPQMLGEATPDPPNPRRHHGGLEEIGGGAGWPRRAAAEVARPGHPTRAGVRGPRSPLVHHADDHGHDRDEINIVAPTLTIMFSKTMLPGWIRAAQKRS